MLKIQAFINYGTWNIALKEMNEAISHVNDFSTQQIQRLSERSETNRLRAKTKVSVQPSPMQNQRVLFDKLADGSSSEQASPSLTEVVAGTGSRINLIFN